MKQLYYAYLQNTPGSKKALEECLHDLERKSRHKKRHVHKHSRMHKQREHTKEGAPAKKEGAGTAHEATEAQDKQWNDQLLGPFYNNSIIVTQIQLIPLNSYYL